MTFYIFWNILRMCETSLMKSELDQNRVSQPRSELTLLDSLIWLHVSLAAFSFLTSSGWFVTVSFSLKFESTVLQRRHRRTFYIYFPAASASLWPSIRSGWRRSSAHRWPEAKRVSERREGEQLHRRRSVASCCSVLQQTARFFNRVRHRGGEGLMLCSGLHMSLMETSDSWRQIKPVQPAPTRSGRMWVALLTAVRIVIRLRAATQEFTDKVCSEAVRASAPAQWTSFTSWEEKPWTESELNSGVKSEKICCTRWFSSSSAVCHRYMFRDKINKALLDFMC